MPQSQSQLRRRASTQGLRLIKFRENSRCYAQYGPYTLVDSDTNAVICWGMTLADVQRELTV